MDFKSVSKQIEGVDPQKGIIIGYASTFNVLDDGGDIVVPGAFSKTIQERGPESPKPRIKALFNHNINNLVGIPVVMKEDDRGLYHETKISPTAVGKDVLQLIQDGVLTEQSIGYDTIQSEDISHDQERPGTRLLKEVRLWEISLVTWGMNEMTPILGLKGMPATCDYGQIRQRVDNIEKALRTGSFSSDELPGFLEEEVKRLKILVKTEGKPFGPYASMEDCISRNGDRDDPAAFCAWLHNELVGTWPGGKEYEKLSAKDQEFLDAELEKINKDKTLEYLLTELGRKAGRRNASTGFSKLKDAILNLFKVLTGAEQETILSLLAGKNLNPMEPSGDTLSEIMDLEPEYFHSMAALAAEMQDLKEKLLN